MHWWILRFSTDGPSTPLVICQFRTGSVPHLALEARSRYVQEFRVEVRLRDREAASTTLGSRPKLAPGPSRCGSGRAGLRLFEFGGHGKDAGCMQAKTYLDSITRQNLDHDCRNPIRAALQCVCQCCLTSSAISFDMSST